MEALEQVKARFERVVPIVSQVVADTDTRFGKAHDLMREMERICDHRVITTIKGRSPSGPRSSSTCSSSPPAPGTPWASWRRG